MMTRPDAGECAPFYSRYIAQVPDGDVLDFLDAQRTEITTLVAGVAEDRGDFRYAEGKWSLRQVVGHIIDTERILSCRALRFARADTTPLPGFQEDDYVTHGNFEARTMVSLAREFDPLRSSTIEMFRSFGEDALARRGEASGTAVSVRAIIFICAGHAEHHLALLRTHYLDTAKVDLRPGADRPPSQTRRP
jgi:hypothetical protein